MSDTDKKNEKGNPLHSTTTHGPGSTQNPSKPLDSSEDLQGNSRPQNATFPKEKPYFPDNWVDPTAFLRDNNHRSATYRVNRPTIMTSTKKS